VLCKEANNLLSSEYEVVLDAFWPEFNFDDSIEEQLRQVVKRLPIRLDGTIPVTIIVPGQATLAVLLMSYLHGILGHFPKVCYLEQSDSGLYLPRFEYIVNAQSIRTAGRRFRGAITVERQIGLQK
jgi:hypothetical protein